MGDKEIKKQAVAKAAIDYIEYDDIVGVGTGSTVNYFIDYLKPLKNKISGAVASSIITQKKLEALGIRVLDLNEVSEIPIYIDGADEVNPYFQLIHRAINRCVDVREEFDRGEHNTKEVDWPILEHIKDNYEVFKDKKKLIAGHEPSDMQQKN